MPSHRLPISEQRQEAIDQLRFAAIGLANANDAWLEKESERQRLLRLNDKFHASSADKPTPQAMEAARSQTQTQFNIRQDYVRKAINAANEFLKEFSGENGKPTSEANTNKLATRESAKARAISLAADDVYRAECRLLEANNALDRAIIARGQRKDD